MENRSKEMPMPGQAELRIRPDQIGWVMEVRKERSFQGKPVGASWRRYGYYNRLESAIVDGLDAALHEGADYEGMLELKAAFDEAKEAVRRMAEDLHKPRNP